MEQQGDNVFPHEDYEVVRRLQDHPIRKVVLAREPTGRRVVQKRIDIVQLQQHNVAEDPFTEVLVYDAVQSNNGHPNILRKLNHYHTPDGRFFVITTEYAEGGDYLEKVLDGLSLERAREDFIQICKGLHHLHASGWSNLDLSPENILLKGDIPVLMDFGAAIPINEPANGYRGKEFYAAPELYANVPCNPILADMWSLGVLLFIMLCRSPPFDRANGACQRFRYVRNLQQPVPGPQNGVERLITQFNFRDKFQGGSLDLVQRLLHIDPAQRISLEDVLAHQFCA